MRNEQGPPPDRLSYTVDQALQTTGMQRTRLYAAIAAGELRSFKHGRRRFVSVDALREWISKLERDAAVKRLAGPGLRR